MASPFAALPAAVVENGTGAPVHYGSPLREQRMLAEGRAIVHRGDRAVISVTGVDRLTWLDSITSQAVAALSAGRGSELLILDPHGHIEHAAAVVDDGATAWLIADAPDAPGLAAWLRRMVFRAQVAVAEEPALAVVGYVGDDSAAARAVLPHVHSPNAAPLVWGDPWVRIEAGGHQYAAEPHPGAGHPAYEAIVAADALGALAALSDTDGGVQAAGTIAADALRIAAWRPRWSAEVDERTLPHELDWLRSAVHLNKGCYRGQETVAKVHNLGHPPRRLVFVHLDGSDAALPAPGSPVRNGEAEVGRITSAALHHELGPIALAVIKRNVPPDALLSVDTGEEIIAGSQEVIVPPSAGAEASVPRLPRLSTRPRA